MRSLPCCLALAALTAAVSGCYRYTPASYQEVAPGESVRLRLSAEEATRYRDLRLADPRLLEGRLVEQGAEVLVVEATVGANDAAQGTRALMQHVSIPVTGIVGMDRKELDRTRTGLFIGAGVAVLAAVVIEARAGSGSPEPGTPGGNEARVVPLLRLGIPLGWR